MDDPETFSQTPPWSEFGILYSTLTPLQARSLEKAILARLLDRFDESRNIFKTELPPSHTLPILAIERYLLESRRGLCRNAHAIIDKASECQQQWLEKCIEQEAHLLRLLRAFARKDVEGTLKHALDEAGAVKLCTAAVPIEAWTDIEVSFRILRIGFRDSLLLLAPRELNVERPLASPSFGVGLLEKCFHVIGRLQQVMCCLRSFIVEPVLGSLSFCPRLQHSGNFTVNKYQKTIGNFSNRSDVRASTT